MLTEQRHEEILRLLKEKGSVTVTELTALLDASESTVRRDISALDQEGLLTRVFGGAVTKGTGSLSHEPTVEQKSILFQKEKHRIARFAASLIRPDEVVFLDAGTTTGAMIGYLTQMEATFVTNAVAHAQQLAAKKFRVFLVGGMLKRTTEAAVGSQTVLTLQSWHFSRGFFGINGIERTAGFTTPDAEEALVKKTALAQSRECFVLADHSKFDRVSAVTVAGLPGAEILTDEVPERYRDCRVTVV